MRRRTSGRRSGGKFSGWLAPLGQSGEELLGDRGHFQSRGLHRSDDCDPRRAIPETLRMYWRAAASISSRVAGGSRPRSSVMFLHIPRA